MAKKRAIALSGGGPVAGIEIGALKAFEEKKIRLINIEMNYGNVNYHWHHANLDQGIKAGYEGTLKQINAYNNGR